MIKNALFFTFVLSISGCSLLPWSSEPNEVLTFLPAEQLTNWDLTAKFSVSSEEGTESGSLRWINQADNDRLDILSPTGAVVARLTVGSDRATLMTDEKTISAASPDELLVELLNVELPVSALKYWVRGLDAPTLSVDGVTKDDSGRIRELNQGGWQLAYSGTIAIESGSNRYEVPRRLTATQGTMEIRWASTEWQTQVQ